MASKAQKCKQCGSIIYFDGICIPCQIENERNRLLALTEEEIEGEIGQILREIEETGKLDKESNLFVKLLDYRDINTSRIAEAAFKKKIFYPAELYKDAPDDVIKAMINIIMQDSLDSLRADKLLSCLAVHGGEEVFRVFLELEKHPRKWREKLHVDPSFYAVCGGWTYDDKGRFVKTIFPQCYPMVKGTLEEKKRSPVKIGLKTEEKCPKCGCRIVNLMEIDARDPRLDFLEINGVIKAKCCPNCFEVSEGDFCRYTIDGESRSVFGEGGSITEDYLEEEGIEELASNTYILGDTPVPLRYAADWDDGSSIGGFGFWIQDCDIRCCPDCGKPMKYLAQIQWDTVIKNMEGYAYIEICKDCNILVMIHQQT